MAGRVLAALVAMEVLAGGAAAQVTCRANVLGAEVCVGVASPEPRSRVSYPQLRFGLGTVQAASGVQSGPKLTPARRTDALGNTLLTAKDLPPDRPLPGVVGVRNCQRDALGNLICR